MLYFGRVGSLWRICVKVGSLYRENVITPKVKEVLWEFLSKHISFLFWYSFLGTKILFKLSKENAKHAQG